MEQIVNIIGGGYAGTEAGLTLAKYGIKVHLFDKKNEAQNFDEENATLSKRFKGELMALKIALGEKLGNLPVTQNEFENIWAEEENLKVFNKKITEISLSEPTIIATGTQTDRQLFDQIKGIFGESKCYNFLPKFPIISGIDEKLVKRGEFYFLPLTKEKTEQLRDAINYFRSYSQIDTIERWARIGTEMLRAKVLRPIVSDQVEYACCKLQKVDNGFMLLNFCTGLPQNAQKTIFRFLFGENMNIERYSSIDSSTTIDISLVLNEFLQTKSRPNLFFAGSIIGTKNSFEAIATGHFTALNMLAYLNRQRYTTFPKNTLIGDMIDKLFSKKRFNLTEIASKYDIIKNIDEDVSKQLLTKFKEDFDARNAWHNDMCSKKKW